MVPPPSFTLLLTVACLRGTRGLPRSGPNHGFVCALGFGGTLGGGRFGAGRRGFGAAGRGDCEGFGGTGGRAGVPIAP